MKLTLLQGDVFEQLPKIPSSSIDAVITDPPYNVLGATQDWDDKGAPDEFMKWTKIWMELCFDKAKDDSCLLMFWGQKYMKELFNLETRWSFKRMLIWHHPNLAKPTNRMYLWTYDPIFYFIKGKPHFRGGFFAGENTDVFRYAKPQSQYNGENKRVHPASKPIELMKKLVRANTEKDAIVLDCFMGGGATGIAALQEGRQFIGIELEQKYFDIAEMRCRKWEGQEKLESGII